jgi:hypothetical protein
MTLKKVHDFISYLWNIIIAIKPLTITIRLMKIFLSIHFVRVTVKFIEYLYASSISTIFVIRFITKLALYNIILNFLRTSCTLL